MAFSSADVQRGLYTVQLLVELVHTVVHSELCEEAAHTWI